MKNIRTILEESTNGVCYNSYKYCADEELRVPTLSYEESQTFSIFKDRYGEIDTSLKKTKDVSKLALTLSEQEPLFRYFLDGSRRAYKVDDIEINKRIFPIMAGQIGVACCERLSPRNFKCKALDNDLVMSLPSEANPEIRNANLFFNNLKDKINSVERVKRTGLNFSKILSYSSKQTNSTEDSKYEHLGIATIQDEMINSEKKIISDLTTKNHLNECCYLIKDGSLQYRPQKTSDIKELAKIKNNYRWVIGVSKLFNPEFSKDKSGKSNAAALANLQLYHRTPAFMFQHDREKWSFLGDYTYSVWYVRIREKSRTESPFAGIVKVEKILITEEEIQRGIDSELVDILTANIINERNPVCYGKDSRWANHLYPVYLTERFLKSKYLSDIHFLNLF
ncbi:hypothetical protein [Dysgonomonas macrotermitis]|uniref:NurA domain-containing protein n=1 Tax=Dysgonomonas macrotermitis TaxID=1346286 RepID=A0A1M5ES24_9BACT|nr:hypothetical protein [Dysgonomonas macrotermitis]SHF81946.1 hypothetical protein SAMN05444362_110123 [Dysgonomonas macrotermitis]